MRKHNRLLIVFALIVGLVLLAGCAQGATPQTSDTDDAPAQTDDTSASQDESSSDTEDTQDTSESEDSEATDSSDESASSGEEASDAEQQEEITLTFWRITGDSAESEAEKRIWDDSGELYEQWRESHPNIDIVIESTPFDEYTTKQLTALRAGGGGDVMLVDNLAVAPAAGTGGLEPLDECISSQDAINPDDWIPGLYSVGTVDGTQYSLPFDTDTRIMFYNKNVLVEAGVDEVPTTWEEYYAAADAVEALDSDVDAMSYSGARFWALSYMWMGPWFNQLGASVLTPDHDASAVLESDTVRAFEHGYKLAQYSPEAAISYGPSTISTSSSG